MSNTPIIGALAAAFLKAGLVTEVPAVEPEKPICPYCGNPAMLVTGAVIYPRRRDLAPKQFWQCAPCAAHVGCHEAGKGQGDGTKPLGRLANAELREAKMLVHELFDDIWADGHMSRRAAYAWLADSMGIAVENCHVGMFSVEQCEQAADICSKFWDQRL